MAKLSGAAKARFNAMHPRDSRGRFIKKGAASAAIAVSSQPRLPGIRSGVEARQRLTGDTPRAARRPARPTPPGRTGTFLDPVDSAPEPQPTAPTERFTTPVGRAIAQAYSDIRSEQGVNDLVSLADIRDALAGRFTPQEIDAEVQRLNLAPAAGGLTGFKAFPQSNQKILTQRERDAAITVGIDQVHNLQILGEIPAPQTPRAARGQARQRLSADVSPGREDDRPIQTLAERSRVRARAAANPEVQRLSAMTRAEAAQELDRLPVGARNALLRDLQITSKGLTTEGKKRRALDKLFPPAPPQAAATRSTPPAAVLPDSNTPVPETELDATPTPVPTATPTRMTKAQYTKLLKEEHVRLQKLAGMSEREAKAAARPAATIDELKERNSVLRNRLRASGVDYRTDEQKRTDDAEKNRLLDEVQRQATEQGFDGPAKRQAVAAMSIPQIRQFLDDVRQYQRRQAEKARAAREGAAAQAAWEAARHTRRAAPRQVQYILDLLAKRRRSGEGGGFFNGPTDRAGIEKLSEADASAYIDSLTGNY